MSAGYALCLICGAVGHMDDDVETARGVASAYAWAVHFNLEHPDVGPDLSRYVALTEYHGG